MNDVDKQIHKFCLRCGRRLKTEESKLKGYGPICEKKAKNDKQNRLFML